MRLEFWSGPCGLGFEACGLFAEATASIFSMSVHRSRKGSAKLLGIVSHILNGKLGIYKDTQHLAG